MVEGCQPYAPATLYSPQAFFLISDTHLCYRLSKYQGLVRMEGLGKLEN
jgi:hypothetical protein